MILATGINPLLAIISETWSEYNPGNENLAQDDLIENISYLPHGFKYADFGTRRRRSSEWHEHVIKHCIEVSENKSTGENFVGTSNLYIAKKYNLTPIGTMAHEWLQAHQQLKWRLADSQKMALKNWAKVFGGDLGIALSDVINTDAFLKDFNDPLLYKLFDGVREDSEPDPINFGHRMINFYLSKHIDPKSKTIVFSNGLDFTKAKEIFFEFRNLINVSFGIGTKLTNDWNVPALNMVIKMVYCNGAPVAKISNSPGKGICEDQNFVHYLKHVYNIKDDDLDRFSKVHV